jgi:hypothetical protein
MRQQRRDERGNSDAIFALVLVPVMLMMIFVMFPLISNSLKSHQQHVQKTCIVNVSTHACTR